MNRPLSAAQIARYENEGFLFPLSLLSADEVSRFRAELENTEVCLGMLEPPLPLWQAHLHFRWAYDLATHTRILDVVEAIIGPDILVHTSSIFRKVANDSSTVPWHQDGHYWRMDRPGLVSAWIALTPSRNDSGCLRVIPGSHRNRLPHTGIPRGDNMLLSGLRLSDMPDESGAVDVVLEPGDASLHHLNAVHGSESNRTGHSRIGFAVRYVAPDVRQELKHHQVVLARGADRCQNYDLLEGPPGRDIDRGIESLARLVNWIRTERLSARAEDSP